MLHQSLVIITSLLVGIVTYFFTKKIEHKIDNPSIYMFLCFMIGSTLGYLFQNWLTSIGI